MIHLGLDPGTSDNMALAALLPDTFPDSIRVAIVEPNDSPRPRDRAVSACMSLREKLMRMALPSGLPVNLIVEWQRPLPGDPNPANICDLSAFAGLGLATSLSTIQSFAPPGIEVFTPLPEEWKGTVKKWAKHNRIVEAAGIERVRHALKQAGCPVPPNLGAFTREFTGMAGNALDAIGLALWGRQRCQLRARVKAATIHLPRP